LSLISPLASIHKNATIHPSVSIGPYTHIGPDVTIGAETKIASFAHIDGVTTIGEKNQIYSFVSIGAAPQDWSYKEEPTKVIIGDHNIIREYVSIHRATTKENHQTIIGNHCFLMAYVHIGHDVVLANHCTLVNGVQLGGHVHIGHKTILAGSTAVAQFTRVGSYCYIGGQSGLDRDIPPFTTALGLRAKIKGLNVIGMKRNGFTREEMKNFSHYFGQIQKSEYSLTQYIEKFPLTPEQKCNRIIVEFQQFCHQSVTTSKVGLALIDNRKEKNAALMDDA
jgi:UDP-N-acetylglucosamine acyltransferase